VAAGHTLGPREQEVVDALALQALFDAQERDAGESGGREIHF
jgi:hypothetical protein